MSMASLEREILKEAREVSARPKLKKSDVVEWSTGELKPEPGETRYRLPKIGVDVCVKNNK